MDTIKKTCEKCEKEFEGIYDGVKLCDECLDERNVCNQCSKNNSSGGCSAWGKYYKRHIYK